MENETILNKDELLKAVQKMRDMNARFATATCLDMGSTFEIIYTFEPLDSVFPLTNLRVLMSKTDTLPSISGIYSAAVIVENEIKGDFDIQISGLPLDFQGTLMHTKDSIQFPLTKAPPAPKTKEGEVKQ